MTLPRLAFAAVCLLPGAGFGDEASPAPPPASPQPTATPRAKATAKPLRSAVNTCEYAALYQWPKEAGIPTRSNLPPAHVGERFEIQSGPRYALDGNGFFETTIPREGMSGGYYWVSNVCFNPS
jgi:hypothetical protein